MKTLTPLEDKFNKNQKQIVKLLNENIDIQYQLELEKAEEIYEEDRTVGRGKKKQTHRLRIMKWKEFFADEDTGEKTAIERSKIIAVDGIKSDGWKEIEYYTYKD